MIQDKKITGAVSKVLQRAERQTDLSKVVRTFVDVGILPQLKNHNHQILYGRRGTGKTHVLRVLSAEIEKEQNTISVYIDCRTLGSTAQFSDESLPMRKRCLALFRDILGPIHNSLLEHIIEVPSARAEEALKAVDMLQEIIVDPVKTLRQETEVRTASELDNERQSFGASSSSNTLEVAFDSATDRQSRRTVESEYRVVNEDKVVFPALYHALSQTLDLADTTLFVLLDEWSSIPRDIQPFLAEFLKRGILPVQKAIVKIAALEYRSQFASGEDKSSLGFEIGADISTSTDLDDYYVYDRNPDQITDIFGNVLVRHVGVNLPDQYLAEQYTISDGRDLATRMFTQRKVFKELVRASEGVIRDLINIFNRAFFHAHRRDRSTIDRKAVVEASRQWFEQDKAHGLDDQMQLTLRRIVDDVIGDKKARSFLLPRNLERHPMIQKLFDARVLHHMQRGYADKDNPGVRYNIYTLDYGTYVDLIGTSKEPQMDLFKRSIDEEVVVPFDDKRSIRRIILDESVLTSSHSRSV